MALINNIYVFVESEQITDLVETTDHAVEEGADLTDHVNYKGFTISITGQIVGKNYDSTLSSLQKLQKAGTLIKYVGTETFSDMMITSFDREKTNTVYGGCKFNMELKKARIAKSPYKKNAGGKTDGGTKQKSKSSTSTYVYHTVKKGDTVWALVNGPYKSLGSSCNDIMNWNPSAFSRKGDFRTLQIGKKLKMGVRK